DDNAEDCAANHQAFGAEEITSGERGVATPCCVEESGGCHPPLAGSDTTFLVRIPFMLTRHILSLALALAALAMPRTARADDDLDGLQEKAIKAAVKAVAPCVVQIETSGGTEIITLGGGGRGAGPITPTVRKGIGPTSGLIVSPDGYIISSAFNFANKPTSIIIAVAGHKERYVAK